MSSHALPSLTLVELLVVIAIIGVVMAVMLQAARKASCRNRLRQIGLAMHGHVAAHRSFPTNGWGYRWVGERSGSGPSPQIETVLTQVMQTPLAVIHYPSGGIAESLPYFARFPLLNVPRPEQAAKCDYGGNGGDVSLPNSPGPERTISPAIDAYNWPDTLPLSGKFFVRRTITPAQVQDGTSNTYLVGENYVSDEAHVPVNRDIGDDTDIRRWADEPPRRDSVSHAPMAFGSTHSDGCHFVFCDWAVRLVRHGIDPAVHRRLGNRRDGQGVNWDEL